MKKCKLCTYYFDKYSCNSPNECDCPNCQGLCACDDIPPDIYQNAEDEDAGYFQYLDDRYGHETTEDIDYDGED